MAQIIKRSGRKSQASRDKIVRAVNSAYKDVYNSTSPHAEIVADKVYGVIERSDRLMNVEEIQDMVEECLMEIDPKVARSYVRYRYDKEKLRQGNPTDSQVLSIVDCTNEEVLQENSNKNPRRASVQRDYVSGIVSKDLCARLLVPTDVWRAHEEGAIHFHDSDYFLEHIHNCCLVNVEDMLANGTVISNVKIDTPKKFSTACNIATQIAAQIASGQYGGQTISLAHLSPYVQKSREKYRDKLSDVAYGKDLDEIVERFVDMDIEAGVQTIQYQVLTLATSNGQTPFISIYMDINEVPEGQPRTDLAKVIAEVLRQRIQGVQNEDGVWVTPAFPKLLYVLDDNNVEPDSEFYWLTELAAKCTAKRMVPDYISAKVMRELKGDVYGCMGCRSFLTPDPVNHKYYGRFNQGVVSINLPYIAMLSKGDKEKFWKLMEKYTELCYKGLMCRHERLEGTSSDISPIHWNHGGLARLKPGEKIDPLLHGNYSTISLGYAGLYECTKYMTGESHTGLGKDFALEVMNFLNAKTAEWKTRHDIAFSLYGTPLESTTYKFAKALKKFPIVNDVNDHNYITNSYHVSVREEIDAFTKLSFESEFQALSPGGAISYVEVPDLTQNIPAVLSVIKFIYNNIMYAELNTKSDYCMECGWDGEIKVVQEDNQLIWKCPCCGNTDQTRMSVVRRTCGYLGSQFWNEGRTEEIRDRVLHL